MKARPPIFGEIPIIDFGDMLIGDVAAKGRIAAAIRQSCEETGFFYIRNHGIPETLLEQMFELGKCFFELPIAEKLEVHKSLSPQHAGYTPILAENTDPKNLGDLHECFDIIAAPLEKNDNGPPCNLWPSSLPALQLCMTRYLAEMLRLGSKLFEAVALSLNLPATFFQPHLTNPTGMLRINYYPPQPLRNGDPSDSRQIGIGAHTDYECFTILAQQADIAALQVWNGESWIEAPAIPGTFVVNIGDQMQRWTNDIFLSTRHRAINMSEKPRISIPFFLGINYETTITALPCCVSESRPAKYEPVIAGDYVVQRLNETYGYS